MNELTKHTNSNNPREVEKGTKIGQVSDFGEIKAELKKVFALIRPKELPNKNAPDYKTPSELDLLISYIVTNYRQTALKEIFVAFNLASLHKLDLKPEQIKCYQFTPEYFSRIMTAYTKHKRTFPKQPKKIEQKQVDMSRFFVLYEQLKAGNYNFKPYHEFSYYLILDRKGIELATPQEKRDILKEVQDQLPMKLREHKEAYLDRCKTEAMKRTFRAYIMSCALDNINLKERL